MTVRVGVTVDGRQGPVAPVVEARLCCAGCWVWLIAAWVWVGVAGCCVIGVAVWLVRCILFGSWTGLARHFNI